PFDVLSHYRERVRALATTPRS
ncbi:MAG: hypothetical protein QOG70_2910, partial [Solirubrobacteraceae bacterium]|nr:hypothetical protein [Solirubrobacteraceae bacterium]